MTKRAFAHFVITRFNAHGVWPQNNLSPPAPKRLTADYLNERFALFERFCLPALTQQSERDFFWLVLFDAETPAAFKSKIEGYAAIYPQFNPIYIEVGSELMRPVAATMQRLLPEGAAYLITSRIDNDDAVGRDFIAEVQACFNQQDDCVIFFKEGFLLQDDRLYARTYFDNPFATRIKRVDWERLTIEVGNPTVFVGQHGHLKQLCAVRYVDNRAPIWLQTLHGSNLGNYRPKHCIRQPFGRLFPDFPFIPDIEQHASSENKLLVALESMPQRLIYRLWFHSKTVRSTKRFLLNRSR